MNTITRTLAALTLLVGCYNPNVPSGLYTCANPGDRCPDGLACVAGTCRYPTQDPQPMPVDMASPAPDMTTFAKPPACARGVEVALSSNMAGCGGNINAGEFNDTLCRPGWRLCQQNDPAAKDPPGFYMSVVVGQQVAPPPLLPPDLAEGWNHGTPFGTTTRYVFGRGTGNYVEKTYTKVFKGFNLAMQCLPGGVTYAGCQWNWADDRDISRINGIGWLCCNY